MDIADIKKAAASDPDLLKALSAFVGEKDRAANLETELEQLKESFAQETEEMAKSLTDAEDLADREGEARKLAERAVAEVIFRQEALVKCLTEAVGPAIKMQGEKLEALHDLVKAIGDKPMPARAVAAIPTPEEAKPEPDVAAEVDFDPADVLEKALTRDRAAGDLTFPTWTALRRAERNLKEFKALAEKENLI